MRFAIWCAVSSKAQAVEDKVSLSEQESRCRSAGTAKGWMETSGPYIVPGESRTRFVNLTDAEIVMPALKAMLDEAQAGKFDILVLYDYTRLRDLLDPVAKSLAAYRVQMFSLGQPVEPRPVDQLDFPDDTASTMQFVSGLTSRAEIAAMKRRYRLGMPRRVSTKGLPVGSAPFGFRKPPGRELDRQAIPIMDPAKAEVVVKIKDLFLTGQSLWQIARRLTSDSIPTPAGHPEWHDVNVRLILKNRFYCGEVIFGRERRTSDPRTGKVRSVANDPARVIVAHGAHAPLWDLATQQRIEDEFARRGKKYTGIRTNRLSNLLYCGICGARVWVCYPGGYSDKHRRWICSVDSHHVSIRDDVLLPRVIQKLTDVLKDVDSIHRPTPEDKRPLLQSAFDDLQARHSRLTDALEAGSLDAIIYSQRVGPIEKRMVELKSQLDQEEQTAGRIDQRQTDLEMLANVIEQVPAYILKAPAQDVNSQLHQLIEKVVVNPNTVELVFR